MSKKICTLIIIVLIMFIGCSKSNSKTTAEFQKTKSTTGETSMPSTSNYVEKNMAKKGIAVDCPEEVKTIRPDLEYGTVTHVTYHSKTCNAERPFNILLPASYDGEKKYPVIYFQHGIFGDENCMIHDGNNKFKDDMKNHANYKIALEVFQINMNEV